MRYNLYHILIMVFIIVYIIIFAGISIANYISYVNICDISIYEQALWNTLHGRIMYNGLEQANQLSLHMSLILFLVLPFYALYQSPITLFILETFCLGLGALGIYLLSVQILKKEKIALLLSLSYLLYPALHGLNLWGFRPIAFAVPSLIFAFYYYEKGDKKIFLFLIGLALLCKENVCLVIAGYGIYLMVIKKDRKTGGLIMIVSLVWFFISVKIIMPLLGGKGFSRIIGYRYKEVGGSFTGIIKMMLTSPITIIKYMFSPLIKIKYLLSLFMPLCFLPLLNPGLVFICLPVFMQNLLSPYFGQHRLLSQYSALMIPFLFLALINSIKIIPEIIPFKKKLQSKFSIRNTTIQVFFVLIVLITEVLFFKGPDIWPYAYGREDLIATAALPRERIRIVNEVMNMIPARSSVSASHDYLIQHLARRKSIFGINKNGDVIKDRKPDYVFIDFFTASYFKIEPLEPILNKEYFNIFKNNGLNLFVRKDISSAYDSRKESWITLEEKQMYNRAHNNQAIKSHFIDIRVDPRNPRFYNKLGVYYIRQKKYCLAIEQFEQAINLRSDYAGAYCNLGTAYIMMGQIEEAMTRWQKALEIEPDHKITKDNIKQLKTNQGNLSY